MRDPPFRGVTAFGGVPTLVYTSLVFGLLYTPSRPLSAGSTPFQSALQSARPVRRVLRAFSPCVRAFSPFLRSYRPFLCSFSLLCTRSETSSLYQLRKGRAQGSRHRGRVCIQTTRGAPEKKQLPASPAAGLLAEAGKAVMQVIRSSCSQY